jgi:uncharacterized protein DUF2252
VKRLVASSEIAGRDNGYPDGERREIVVSSVAAYHQAMGEFAKLPTLEVCYAVAEMDALQARLAPQRSAADDRRRYRSLGQRRLLLRSPCSWAVSTASLRLLTPSLL